MRRRRRWTIIRPVAVRLRSLSVVTALVLATMSCTGDDDAAPEGEPSTSAATGSAPTLTEKDAALEVRIAHVGGGITQRQRRVLKQDVSKPVAAWVGNGVSAAVSAEGSHAKAFAGWTRDAARLARRDSDVTTSATLAADLSGLVIETSRVHLYIYARGGVTGGATARVRLRLVGERQDGSSASYIVAGRLYLTRDRGTWRIFGYDLHREERR